MYKLCTYVPEAELEAVKQALFEAGAGRGERYDWCCWQTLGQGQFRPLENASPHLGEVGQVHQLPEFKLEILVEDDCLAAVVQALLQAHPYEQPAWDAVQVITDLPLEI